MTDLKEITAALEERAAVQGPRRILHPRRRLHQAALWIADTVILASAAATLIASSAPWVRIDQGSVEFPNFRTWIRADAAWLAALWVYLLVRILLGSRNRRGWMKRILIRGLAGLFLLFLVLTHLLPDRRPPERVSVFAEGFSIQAPIPFDPDHTDPEAFRAPPSRRHLLGTDTQGRDLLSRLIHGGRVSLLVAFCSTLIAVSLGLLFGAVCGFFGGLVDLLLMRVLEIFLCFPQLFLLILVFAYLPGSLLAVVAMIGLVAWTSIARLVRAEVLRIKNHDFVLAARALGCPSFMVLIRHVLPLSVGPTLVAASFCFAGAMISEASLSFLGLGLPQGTPTWGRILFDGKGALDYAPWISLFPGLLLFLAIASIHFVGERLRDALDPRARVIAPEIMPSVSISKGRIR